MIVVGMDIVLNTDDTTIAMLAAHKIADHLVRSKIVNAVIIGEYEKGVVDATERQ